MELYLTHGNDYDIVKMDLTQSSYSILQEIKETKREFIMRDYERILGCLVGGAAGDALGYAVEFDKEAYIFSQYGPGGIREYDLTCGKAIISDDTQMTLFTAAGILLAENPYDYGDFIQGEYEAHKEWYLTQNPHMKRTKTRCWLTDIPELNERRAPGITCLNALSCGKMGSPYDMINNSKGCGGVMRVAPIGLFYDVNENSKETDAPALTIEDIDAMGAGAAAITHCHPLGYLPGAGLVHVISRISHDPYYKLKDAVNEMISTVTSLYPDEEKDNQAFEKLMTKAVKLSEENMDDLDAIHQLGEGWVGEEALAIALYCALKYENDFDAAIIASVNHKGDSDSTGAITGNILGAYLGIDGIGDKYKKNLELMDVYERLAKELAGL